MYNLQKNNYHLKPKSSTIYTPPAVSQFLFNLLPPYFGYQIRDGFIFDPCCGLGSLLDPWKKDDYPVYGIDKENSDYVDKQTDFLTWDGRGYFLAGGGRKIYWELEPQLVLCNPPFNGYKGKAAAEVWLDKIIELFGKEVPIVLFTPYNFRLPWKADSKRLSKFLNGEYPPIASIISLPTKGLWEGVIFHSEILIFNVKGLKAHYFYHENP